MFESDLVGRTLGPYTVISKIGQGGMAVVYKAYETSLERFVAIKVLPPSLAMESGFNTRFEREAKAIAKLDHPNILPVYGYGHQDGLSYLVMRFVPAGTLKEKMHQPLDLTYIAEIMKQVGKALEYAHQNGVIHRDIKPSNILMADDHWPLLTDFGLAKMMENPSHLTGTGVGIGTPAYMSPEQAQGLDVDGRTDIYSLGVMLYEMVIGKVPYEAETPMAVVLKHINAPLPLPSQSKPDLPESVEMVILKALAKKPEDRFQSVSAFVNALDSAIAQAKLQVDLPLDVTVPKPETQPTLIGSVESKTVLPPPELTAVSAKVESPEDSATPVIQESSSASDHPQPASIETVTDNTPQKTKRERRPFPWKVFAGAAGLLILVAVFIGGYGNLQGQKTDKTPTSENFAVVINTPTASSPLLPSPTPVLPSFVIKFTSSSDWATLTLSNTNISASSRVTVSGSPVNSSLDGLVIRLNQNLNQAIAGHQVSVTYQMTIRDIENLDELRFIIDKGCIGSAEIELSNTHAKPPIAVFRKSSATCKLTPFSITTESLKPFPVTIDPAWLDIPLPPVPPEADSNESKYVFTCFDTYPPKQQLCTIKGRVGQYTQLTKDFKYHQLGRSQWTTDGSGIYFSAQTLLDGPWATYRINADGTGLKKVMDDWVTFSPDNQTLAYTYDCAVLRLMNADGADRRILQTPGVKCIRYILWSPDGSQLAFADVFELTNKAPSLWVINQDGTNLHRIYQFETPIWDLAGLAWGPDGKSVGVWYEVKKNTGKLGLLLDAAGASDPQAIGWDMPTWWTPSFWPQ